MSHRQPDSRDHPAGRAQLQEAEARYPQVTRERGVHGAGRTAVGKLSALGSYLLPTPSLGHASGWRLGPLA